MDKRQHPRFPARFTVPLLRHRGSGEGNVVDLSLRGCCVNPRRPCSRKHAHDRVHILAGRPPITILEAVVRWTREGRFGIEFLSLLPEEWARLQHNRDAVGTAPLREKADRRHFCSCVTAIGHASSAADPSPSVCPVVDGTGVCSRSALDSRSPTSGTSEDGPITGSFNFVWGLSGSSGQSGLF